MTIPPEAGVAALLAQALIMLLPYALRRGGGRASEHATLPVPPESEHTMRTRVVTELALVESTNVGMPDNWREYVDRATANYLGSDRGRAVLDAHIQHRMRSMLTGILLSCGGIRIDDHVLSGLRHQVIDHVRDALKP